MVSESILYLYGLIDIAYNVFATQRGDRVFVRVADASTMEEDGIQNVIVRYRIGPLYAGVLGVGSSE
jgi:hypothetical protein